MKSIKLIISVALVSLLALGSCKSPRTATPSAPATSETTPEAPETDAFASVARTYKSWSDVKMPVKIELQQPKRFSVSGNLSMTAGRAVSVQLRMFGIEVGNAYIDSDSVIAVVKPMGVYYAESTARFTAAAGFGIADIQAMLLGRAFVPGYGQLTTALSGSFTSEPLDGGEYMFMPKVQPANAGYFYTAVLGESPAVTGVAVEVNGHKPAFANFSDIKTTAAGNVAEKIRMRATVRNHNIECTITNNTGKAEWDKGAEVNRPAIPRNARRLSTEQLLNVLKSL